MTTKKRKEETANEFGVYHENKLFWTFTGRDVEVALSDFEAGGWNLGGQSVERKSIKFGFGEGYSWTQMRGGKSYELSDHLGNVAVVVGGRRLAVDSNTDLAVDFFEAEVLSARDFYPFGMVIPERSFSTQAYRYGFNGKEFDSEWKGEGNSYDYGFRVHDARVGRFLSVDPLAAEYPWYTPYQYAGNKPTRYIDLDGLEEAPKEVFDLVSEYLGHAHLRQSNFFKNIPPELVLAQVMQRVKNASGANFIDQGKETWICGPAMVAHIACSHDPEAYARSILWLYTNGFSGSIKSNASIQSATPNSNGDIEVGEAEIPAIDFIMMHSLRYSENDGVLAGMSGYDAFGFDSQSQGTLPGEIDEMMDRITGGNSVAVDRYTSQTSNEGITQDIYKMQGWLISGKSVGLLINYLNFHGNRDEDYWTRNFGLHYIEVKSISHSKDKSGNMIISINFWDHGATNLNSKEQFHHISEEDYKKGIFDIFYFENQKYK
jgi:RHS repeat-associated protein